MMPGVCAKLFGGNGAGLSLRVVLSCLVRFQK